VVFDDYLSSVSGGDHSLLPRHSLDWEARRFLSGALDCLGGAPVRVYAGLASGADPEQRVALAVAELDRLGGFERGTLVTCSPTGRGYVNPTALEAIELLTDGDVATVAVQYGDRRSIRSAKVLPLAARTHRLLLRALRHHIDQLDPHRAPQLVVFAESLGAWASQEALAGCGGPDRIDDVRPDRGLWVGTPHGSRARLGVQHALERTRRGSVVVTESGHEVTAPTAGSPVRFVFHAHVDDPVVNFNGASLAWRRPAWIGRQRPQRRWWPVITLVRTMLQIDAATRPAPGRFHTSAHDYRAELARLLRLVLGRSHVTDDELRRIDEQLLHIERRRAKRTAVLGPAPARIPHTKAKVAP